MAQPREPIVLITGVTGQVGVELLARLNPAWSLIALDRSRLDLSDLCQIRRLVAEVRPSVIVNAAAYTAVDKAESDAQLAMLINSEVPGVLAEEARKVGALLVHYSTDYVFDGAKAEAYVETDQPNPLNMYGATKLAGERAIEQAGGAWVVLRTSWVYGTHGKNFLLTMLRLAAQKQDLSIVADQFGAPTWAATIADMTARMLRETAGDAWAARTGIYHLTASGSTSWAGFAEAIFEQAGLAPRPKVTPIEAIDYPTPARRPQNSRLSCEKFAETFGIRPPRWDEELRRCLVSYHATQAVG